MRMPDPSSGLEAKWQLAEDTRQVDVRPLEVVWLSSFADRVDIRHWLGSLTK
jgi:hypothetical protein